MFYTVLVVMLLMAERFAPLAMVVLLAGMLTWMVERVKRHIRPSYLGADFRRRPALACHPDIDGRCRSSL